MLEVCGGEEREKLANQSCESPQGTEAPGGCWFGLLQAAGGKLGVPREYPLELSVQLPAQPQLVGVVVVALLATVSAE